MTILEVKAFAVLNACSLQMFSRNKRFIKDMYVASLNKPDLELTPKQRDFLWECVYLYRKQILDNELIETMKAHREAKAPASN